MSGYLLAATLISVAAGLLGALIVMLRPNFGVMFLGAQTVANLDQHKMWTDSVLSIKPQAASGIMTNNITVCFLTFAGGITAGLFTLYSLFNNGLMLGAIAVVCRQHHMALSLWSFVAAHGALEIPSIMISGAAGLRLAAGILFPGMLRRRAALAQAGLEAVQLVSGHHPAAHRRRNPRSLPLPHPRPHRPQVRRRRRPLHRPNPLANRRRPQSNE